MSGGKAVSYVVRVYRKRRGVCENAGILRMKDVYIQYTKNLSYPFVGTMLGMPPFSVCLLLLRQSFSPRLGGLVCGSNVLLASGNGYQGIQLRHIIIRTL